VFLGRHNKVVRLVLVVDDVLQINASGRVEVFEESDTPAANLSLYNYYYNYYYYY